MRKLIDVDDDTLAKLTQLGRDRMATIQELADEAFAYLLKKHGVPLDLKDALKKSARSVGGKTISAKTISTKNTRAFSSEVGTGSREENASNQKARARLRFNQKLTPSSTKKMQRKNTAGKTNQKRAVLK
jgi:hypothetical protein